MSERGYGDSAKDFIGCGDEDCLCKSPEQSDYSRDTASKEFASAVWEIMDEIGNLLISKQMDYGPGNVNNAHGGPINGLLVRIGDKFERLKNLFKKDKVIPQHESIEDSFKDLANYAVIGIMIQRGKWPK
jgi:hypothetical protein